MSECGVELCECLGRDHIKVKRILQRTQKTMLSLRCTKELKIKKQMQSFCRKWCGGQKSHSEEGARGQVEDLTAEAKPHTTLGPSIHLNYTTCSDICVTAGTHWFTLKKLKSNQISGGNDTEHFILLFHFFIFYFLFLSPCCYNSNGCTGYRWLCEWAYEQKSVFVV